MGKKMTPLEKWFDKQLKGLQLINLRYPENRKIVREEFAREIQKAFIVKERNEGGD